MPRSAPILLDRRTRLYVGTSGWIYKHWRGLFYPKDLPTKRWFEHYAKFFPAVEINNTFYRLPSEEAFIAWREQAPLGWDVEERAPVARVACFLLSDWSRGVTGEILHVDGGFHAMGTRVSEVAEPAASPA